MQCWLCENEIRPEETSWTQGEAELAWHWSCMQLSENPDWGDEKDDEE